MKELDDIRYDVIDAASQEALTLWQKRYRGMKCFRKGTDTGYKYKFESRQELSDRLKKNKCFYYCDANERRLCLKEVYNNKNECCVVVMGLMVVEQSRHTNDGEGQ